MESAIQHGYLVLADISGYTSFLAESELDHAPYIMHSILSHLVQQLTPTLDLAEVEGDAVFAYAPASTISRGELLLELIEATYVAFRDQQQTMQHNAVCPCKACQAIPTLGLKFVTHYGDYVLQDVAGKIAIARYGKSWRGIKPKVAAEHGATALHACGRLLGGVLEIDPLDWRQSLQ